VLVVGGDQGQLDFGVKRLREDRVTDWKVD